MVTVAVAGGTGGIGRSIVDELVRQGKHKVLILSRKASTTFNPSVPVVEINYNDSNSMKQILDDHKVDVVISAIILSTSETSKAQLNLIAAASESSTVNRFIPSEYGIDNTPDLLPFYPEAQFWIDAESDLKKSRLEYTRILIGWLMDYYGIPHVKSNMKPVKYILDFENHRAAVPGSGDEYISMLHTIDLGKYVGALLDVELGGWDEVSAFVGDRTTWNEVVRVAERVTGKKWHITHDTLSDLENGKATVFEQPEGSYTADQYPEEIISQMWAAFGVFAVKGILDISGAGVTNDRFPEIKPWKVADLIETAWGGKKAQKEDET